jgi:hypothetical protein
MARKPLNHIEKAVKYAIVALLSAITSKVTSSIASAILTAILQLIAPSSAMGICLAPGQSKSIDLIVHPNLPEVAATTDEVLQALSRHIHPCHRLMVSRVSGQGIEVFFDGQPSRKQVQFLRSMLDGNHATLHFDLTPSSEADLIKALQSIKDRVDDQRTQGTLAIVVVTSGSRDPKILAEMKQVAASINREQLLKVKAKILIIGLKPENRPQVVKALAPLADYVEFAGSDPGEWSRLIRKLD